jgi:hypothetical protein
MKSAFAGELFRALIICIADGRLVIFAGRSEKRADRLRAPIEKYKRSGLFCELGCTTK